MKKLNVLCPLLMTLAMIGLSELLGEKEIIFPEIAALTVGAWLVPKQPWQVSRFKLWGLMSLSALAGLFLSCLTPLPMIIKIMMAFVFVGFSLTLSRTTLFPMISACILPILMSTTSVIYPLSVSLSSSMIILVQYILEITGAREPLYYTPCHFDFNLERKTWFKRLIYFTLIAFLPCLSHQYFFIAPPLIVTFVELSQPTSPARQKPLKVITLTSLAALTGMLFSLLHVYTPIPLTLCAVLATLLVLIYMKQLSLFLPPAGAIAILPMILPTDRLIFYAPEVMVGVIIFTLAALKGFSPSESLQSLTTQEPLNLAK